jgi:PEP-CTERM motif
MKKIIFIAMLCLTLAWLSVVSAPVHALLIDGFNDDQGPVQVGDGISGPAWSTKYVGSPVLGEYRDIYVNKYGTSGLLTGKTASGLLDIYNNSTNIDGGRWVVTYDGSSYPLNPTGLGGVDLTDSGASNALKIDITTASLDGATLSYLEVLAYTNATNWSSYKVDMPIAGILSIPFTAFTADSGAGANFSNIGALSIGGRFQWPGTGHFGGDAQIQLNYVETYATSTPIPEPATMLLLGSGLIGLAGYGRKKFFKK